MSAQRLTRFRLVGQMSPNEVRVEEDQDTVEGLDWYCLPANTAVFNGGEIYIPGQDLPGKETPAEETADAKPETQAEQKTDNKATARLLTIANSLAERVIRKEAKGKIDAEFIADVLTTTVTKAAEYLDRRKKGAINEENARAALVELAMGEITSGDGNRDSKGRFAPGASSDAHALLSTPAVHAQMGTLYNDARHTFYPQLSSVQTKKQEYSFTVNQDGSVTPITTSGTDNKNQVEVPPGTQAIIHTILWAMTLNPVPAMFLLRKRQVVPLCS